jgi:predicted DNA-binding transcriptional regulator YafY
MGTQRLFQIYLRLLPGEQVTAAELAAEMGASERTIYRDVQRLVEAGLQVHGAAGIGYRLREPPALPPLLLTADEMRALVAGAYAAQGSGDAAIAQAAGSLLDKVRAIVPPRSRAKYGLRS